MSQTEPETRLHPAPATRPEFVRLTNRIAGRNRPLRFQWNGQTAEFTFSGLRAAPRGGWCLGLQIGGHEFSVALSRLPDVAWVSPTLAGIDIQGLPPELACGLIEACFGEIFAALGKTGVDVRIVSVEPFSFRKAAEETVEWCVNRGTETGWMRGTIAGDDAALGHLANIMEQAPVEPLLGDASLPVPVTIVAGHMRLPLVSLKEIELHDVLLVDVTAYMQGRQCQLWAAGRALGQGGLENQTFTLKQLNPAGTATMGDAATKTTVDDLEIQLTFMVGQTTLTVGELRSLAPGFVFELPAAAGDGVTISANGRPIGKGELIEVGDRVGVRVTEFSAS